MIRITQSYVISQSIKYFTGAGWEVLYFDRPGGRRSGIGLVAKINGAFEGIYNLSPDLLAIQGNKLLLVEVDQTLTEEYFEKFGKYQEKSDDLISSLSGVLNREIAELEFGFVAIRNRLKINIPADLHNFHYVHLVDDNLTGEIFNPS